MFVKGAPESFGDIFTHTCNILGTRSLYKQSWGSLVRPMKLFSIEMLANFKRWDSRECLWICSVRVWVWYRLEQFCNNNRVFSRILYIAQILAITYPLKWFYSQIACLSWVLCLVMFHRRSPDMCYLLWQIDDLMLSIFEIFTSSIQFKLHRQHPLNVGRYMSVQLFWQRLVRLNGLMKKTLRSTDHVLTFDMQFK